MRVSESAAPKYPRRSAATFLRFALFAVGLDVPRLGALEAQFADVTSRQLELRHRQAGKACRSPEVVTLQPATLHEALDLRSPALVVHRAVGPPAAIRVPPGSVRCSAVLDGWN